MKYKHYYSDGTSTSSVHDDSKILHREDGPAIEYDEGHRSWYINGKRHREDGPALEYADGHKAWYLNGKRHREDGPAIEYSNGHKAWYVDDMELRTLTKKYLIKYMELNNLTVAHLLTDSDEFIRINASKYDWKK